MTNEKNTKTGSSLDPTQVDSVEGGMISLLWRKVLLDLNLTQHLSYLAREAEKATNKNESEASKVKSRTQFINQATAKSMTYKIFIRLLRYLVGVTKIRITIDIERANGKTSTHSTPFFNIGAVDRELTPSDGSTKKLEDAIRAKETSTEGNNGNNA